MKFIQILETDEVVKYLQKRGLLRQYKKSKQNILGGDIGKTFLKQRQPKGSGVWYFRINKQYRALGYIQKEVLIVVHIDNHQ